MTIVEPETAEVDEYDFEPDWIKDLKDQVVTLGKDLTYHMGSRKDDRNESQVTVEVNS